MDYSSSPEKNLVDVRNLNDYEFELVREVAAQIAGYEPSEMWGKLTREGMRGDRKHYEDIMDSDSQQHLHLMAQFDEKGGSFSNVLKHVLNVGSKVVSGGSKVLGYASKHPQIYKYLPYVGQIDPSLMKVGSDLLGMGSKYMQKGADALPSKRRKLNDGNMQSVSINNSEVHKIPDLDQHNKHVEFQVLNKLNNQVSQDSNPRILSGQT